MAADDVLALLDRLAWNGVRVWLDGGWGVDALLGEQTREHDDVDLLLPRGDVDAVVRLLTDEGYALERDLLPTAVAFRHPDGRGVDLHPVAPTPDGGGDQDLGDGTAFHYDAPVTGTVDGREIACCSVEAQLATHTGYEPDGQDRADVAALVARFSVAPPPGYS